MQTSSTKDRILNTALELFAGRGVDGVSIAMITRRVGIAKSSLYAHFPSKQAILTGILDLYRAEIAKRTFDPTAYDEMVRTMTPEDFWNRILDRYLETWSSPYLVRVSRLIVLEQYKTEVALQLILAETHRILRLSETIFRRMVTTRRIKPLDPADLAREYAYAIRGMLLEYDVLKAHDRDTTGIMQSMRSFIHSFCAKITKGDHS